MKIYTALEAVGATLVLCPYYFPLLTPSNLLLYHHGFPVTHLVGGLLLDMLAVALLTLGFLIAIERLPAPAERTLHALFAAFLLWRIAAVALSMLITPDHPLIAWSHQRKLALVAMLLLAGTLAFWLPRATQRPVRAVRLLVAGIAFSAVWIVPHLCLLALVRPVDDTSAASHPPATNLAGANRRLVWILFDELSYDQTFDHPSPGMRLPNLDRLRAESVSFSNLKPAGYYTELIIPSLFLGRRINTIRSSMSGDLWYKDASQDRWLAYDPNATLFAVARRNGWSSGVDGWFNPYCHLLAPLLSACSWEPFATPVLQMEAYGASENKSTLEDAAALPEMLLDKLADRDTSPANAHIQEYRNVMARADTLLQDSQVNFVFLHIPAPHPPGIYDRRRHVLRPGGTYLDNLVLADDTLGGLMQEIDATASAAQTTVIVSSDHSWRIPMWKPGADWTAEEEVASGGRFDQRPVLLIHFPGENAGSDVRSTEPELLEHDILADMLEGKMENPDDLADFLTQQVR